jgi:hypothetical protein
MDCGWGFACKPQQGSSQRSPTALRGGEEKEREVGETEGETKGGRENEEGEMDGK